jgi:hypothetical protein
MVDTLTPANALNIVFDDVVANLRLTSARTFDAFRAKGRLQQITKTRIDWTVDIGGGAAAIEAVTADGAATATDDVVPAQLGIGQYRIKHQFSLSKIDINDAKARAPQELADLFRAHISRGITHVTRSLNQLLWTGAANAASANIGGFQTVIADPTATYATINPATVTNWVPVVSANGGTARPLTRALFTELDKLVFEAETTYDMILMNPNMAERYMTLWQGITLENSAMSSQTALKDGFLNVDVGLMRKFYNGIPIIEDPMCPDGEVYFVYSPEVTIYGMPLGDIPSRQDPQFTVNNMSLGIPTFIAELPSNNSAARKFELGILPQLQVFNRKFVAKITDIDVT